jgi:pimeloyl-ACP methyl ester carboxylesterase
VIDDVAPTGPIMLVGHSLGGMVVMALADADPDLFGSRIVATALICTSPGRLAEATLGMPAAVMRQLRPHAPRLVEVLARRRDFVEHVRRAGMDIGVVMTRRLAFGSDHVSPGLARFTARMIASTPVDVFAEYFPEFDRHDKEAALPVFKRCAMLIIAGADDLVTPADHSRGMAEQLPEATLLVLPECGHVAQLEHPQLVNAALRRLARQALADAS